MVRLHGPLRMVLRAKLNGKMRNVSPAMARRLRAKGIDVIGAGAAPNKYVVPPVAPQVNKLDDVLPKTAAPVVAPPSLSPDPNPIEVLSGLIEHKLDAPGAMKTTELTDEELERLTAPEVDGGK